MYLSKNRASDLRRRFAVLPQPHQLRNRRRMQRHLPQNTRGILTCPSSVKIRFISSGKSSSTESLTARIAIAGIPYAAIRAEPSKLSISTASDRSPRCRFSSARAHNADGAEELLHHRCAAFLRERKQRRTALEQDCCSDPSAHSPFAQNAPPKPDRYGIPVSAPPPNPQRNAQMNRLLIASKHFRSSASEPALVPRRST